MILTSLEMCLGNSGFAVLLKEPRWSRGILLVVVDEAHCIHQWDTEFRKHYTTLEHVHSILGMNAENLFHLNLGNGRHNIVPLV